MPSAKWLFPPIVAVLLTCGGVARANVGGASDGAHAAVVRLVLATSGGGFGVCSGTIIENSGGHAVVLTAAHCFEQARTQVTVQLGADANAPDATYAATSWSSYPTNQTGSTDPYHDLAVVRFDGAPGNLPVIPLAPMSAYGPLTNGQSLVLVGYGVQGAGQTDSTKRKTLATAFDHVFATRFDTQTPSGTVCHGDSGGAVLDPNGGDHLIAVIRGEKVYECQVGGGEGNIGLHSPDVRAWLRSVGVNAPDGPQPNGAECANDASCASGACIAMPTPGWKTGTTSLCHEKLANNTVCAGASQCLSNYCKSGGCASCSTSADCASGQSCDQGVCIAPPASSPSVDGGAASSSTDDASGAGGGAPSGSSRSPDGADGATRGGGGNGATPSGPSATTDAPASSEEEPGGCAIGAATVTYGDPVRRPLLLVLALAAWARRRTRTTR